MAVTKAEIIDALEKLRGSHYDGGCESCGYGGGWQSNPRGEYLQWIDLEAVLDRLFKDDKRSGTDE
jgi:hypothetical protein